MLFFQGGSIPDMDLVRYHPRISGECFCNDQIVLVTTYPKDVTLKYVTLE
jgi:hypothetical protein